MSGNTESKEIDMPPPINISDEDIYSAMKEIPGYLDITPGDFKEVFRLAYQHAIDRFARSVKAKDVMTKNVIYVTKTTPLKKAAEAMAQHGISGVPVIAGNGNEGVVGVISEKDFLSHMGAKDVMTFMGVVAECLNGKACLAVPVRRKNVEDVMSSPAVTVDEDTSIKEIANIFSEKNINRVPVIDNKGNLRGIVSRADILQSSLLRGRD
jgi:CBS domain-containing protein